MQQIYLDEDIPEKEKTIMSRLKAYDQNMRIHLRRKEGMFKKIG